MKLNKALQELEGEEGVFPEFILKTDSRFRHLAFAGRQKRELADDMCSGAFARKYNILLYPHTE